MSESPSIESHRRQFSAFSGSKEKQTLGIQPRLLVSPDQGVKKWRKPFAIENTTRRDVLHTIKRKNRAGLLGLDQPGRGFGERVNRAQGTEGREVE